MKIIKISDSWKLVQSQIFIINVLKEHYALLFSVSFYADKRYIIPCSALRLIIMSMMKKKRNYWKYIVPLNTELHVEKRTPSILNNKLILV